MSRKLRSPFASVNWTSRPPPLCLCAAQKLLCATPPAGLSPKGRRNNAFFDFWDVTSQIANGLVFFFVGASVVNFFLRWVGCWQRERGLVWVACGGR